MDEYDVSESRTPVGRQTLVQRGEEDLKNILALAKTNPFIKQLMREMAGLDLQENEDGDGMTLVRIGKPKYTIEFCNSLANFLIKRVNEFTVRSDFKLEEIQVYNYYDTLILGNLMATEGIQNFVSEQTWKLALDFLEKHTVDDETEKTRWQSLMGIKWDYNQYFSIDHLNALKQYVSVQNSQFENPDDQPYPDLKNESLGQDNHLMEDITGLMWFVDAGRRKSKDALMLKHERAVYQEQITQSSTPQKQGFLGKMMSGIKAMATRTQ